MSPCKLVSVTAVHRHVVVDIHALVVNPLLKHRQQHRQHTGLVVKKQLNGKLGWLERQRWVVARCR